MFFKRSVKSPLAIKAQKSLAFINNKIIQHFSDIDGLSVEQRVWEHEDGKVPSLPKNRKALYSFHLQGNLRTLKVGQVSQNNQARYSFHHYNVIPALSSTLARSICDRSPIPDVNFTLETVNEWIKKNTVRIDFLLPINTPQSAMNTLEAALIGEWAPLYEGKRGS
ncbi:hypothetical protein RI570_17405 [Brucella pseudogrignonensis]|uniref:hypothetical protein n=1 Tax=Brucella pseudogrignonensis TaxID=419475 RepID=UPI0028B68103|nr:hypothetical protein [Brucella pseudogrignonensis]MDT6941882.1 hypothetical protein [Brucella pseudogrignonensis]